MCCRKRLPEVIVFAGPNGSGKSTITKLARVTGHYINADDIKRVSYCTDTEAAKRAEQMREEAIAQRADFTFETVLSTDRNLNLLRRARDGGYFVRCVYVLTSDVGINIARVRSRVELGGHDVPVDKIRSRYKKALALVPSLYAMSCTFMITPSGLFVFSRNVRPNISFGRTGTGISITLRSWSGWRWPDEPRRHGRTR